MAGGGILRAISDEYLLATQPSELERLRLQSVVCGAHRGGTYSRRSTADPAHAPWTSAAEPWAGFGSSASGVGPSGQIVGTDLDERLLDAARSFLEAEGISNVELVVDDLFESKLEPQSFDLVHARYQIAPLGRGREQVASYRRLVRPGGLLVLEEWDLGSWHFDPPAAAAERLIRLLSEIFAVLGGEAGRRTS